MGMRLKSTKSKYSESFSIIDDYTHPETNKRSTFVVEALGSLNSLMEKYQTTDREVVVNHLKDYIEERKQQLKAENGKMLIEVAQKDLIEKDETGSFTVELKYFRSMPWYKAIFLSNFFNFTLVLFVLYGIIELGDYYGNAFKINKI